MAEELETTQTLWIVNPAGAIHTVEVDMRIAEATTKKGNPLSDGEVARVLGAPTEKVIPAYAEGNMSGIYALQQQGGWRPASPKEVEEWIAAQIPNEIARLHDAARRDHQPAPTADDEAAAVQEFYRHQGLSAPKAKEAAKQAEKAKVD